MPIAQWLNEICLISHVPTSGNSTGMRGRNSARIENSEWGEAGIPENRELGMGRSGNSARIENSEWGEAGIPENRELGMGRSGNSARIENSEWGEAGIPENRELGMGRSGNLENTSGLENGLLSTNVILATLWDLSTLRRLWTYWALRGLLRIVVD